MQNFIQCTRNVEDPKYIFNTLVPRPLKIRSVADPNKQAPPIWASVEGQKWRCWAPPFRCERV